MRLLVLLALVVAPLSAHPHNSSAVSSHRDAKLFFSFITIARDSCDTGDTSFPAGTCYSTKDCSRLGGTAGNNRCAKGLGVCCRLTQTCGETIYTNRTYFVNPGSPSTDSTLTTSPCRVRVDLIGDNVCQLRLDFKKFSLAQPDTTSVCNNDMFRITGTTNAASIPTICGENAGQHLYVDVDPSANGPTLEIDIDSSTTFSREWAIEVTQIKCDSVERAPNGCRQFYRTTSGNIKSFNFKVDEPPYTAAEIVSKGKAGTLQLHLADQNYRVCIMQQTGFCSIRWTPKSAQSFIMTGNFILASVAIGTADGWINAYTGAKAGGAVDTATDVACADYVVIPGGEYAAVGTIAAGQSDRYCGGTFSTVTSTSHPFGLHVKTDDAEPFTDPGTDTANIGFSLEYRMLSTNC